MLHINNPDSHTPPCEATTIHKFIESIVDRDLRILDSVYAPPIRVHSTEISIIN